jgi:hypothetical protein
MYSCIKKEKWHLLKTVLRKGGKGDKEEWWREWNQLWYIVRTLVNVTMYPQYNRKKI